jgi:bile acid:Na+ symporter, BASS family
MQRADRRNSARFALAGFVRRNVIWLLLGCYAAAAIWPTPGIGMRQWRWVSSALPATEISLPLMLLAVLLFCAAVQTDATRIRALGSRPWALLLGTLAVWVVPALLVVAASAVLPHLLDAESSAELLVGLALVASMPVANSSVAWTQLVRGNLALSLGLVLVTIFLSPWVTPTLLTWLRLTMSAADRSHFEALVTNFSGAFFITWVILPTAAGLACRHSLGAERVAAMNGSLTLASVASLLVLNYVNAALALPKVFRQPQFPAIVLTALLAVAVSAVGIAAGWAIGRALKQSADARRALMFGLGMKHTGLALLLAGAVLAAQKLAILMIVLATLAQHLLAAAVEWRSVPDGGASDLPG